MRQVEIGILALQGDFEAHQKVLSSAGFRTKLIRGLDDWSEKLEGLVLPGGESTVQLKLLEASGLWEVIDESVRLGMRVVGTCAGAILAAAHVLHAKQKSFGWVPIVIERNAYGDQRYSFERRVLWRTSGGEPCGERRLIFIRAPKIAVCASPKVRVHLTLDGFPVLVSYENILLATFHPELAGDVWFHAAWFRQDCDIGCPSEERAASAFVAQQLGAETISI